MSFKGPNSNEVGPKLGLTALPLFFALAFDVAPKFFANIFSHQSVFSGTGCGSGSKFPSVMTA
jgi:hypothetical protein